MNADTYDVKGFSLVDKEGAQWVLGLYVAGASPKSLLAFSNLKIICEQYLEGRFFIEVIDLLRNPRLARDDQIFAIPTLVRHAPNPPHKIIGDLSNTERVLVGLGLREPSVPPGYMSVPVP